jgi:hypothetical protein
MLPYEKRGKLDAKRIKCMFLGYCESMKAYRLRCLETKTIVKNRDVVLIKDRMSIRNDLEMCPSGRNASPTIVVVDESSKFPLFDGGEQFVDDNEEVQSNGVAIEEAHEGLANEDIVVKAFGKERQ